MRITDRRRRRGDDSTGERFTLPEIATPAAPQVSCANRSRVGLSSDGNRVCARISTHCFVRGEGRGLRRTGY